MEAERKASGALGDLKKQHEKRVSRKERGREGGKEGAGVMSVCSHRQIKWHQAEPSVSGGAHNVYCLVGLLSSLLWFAVVVCISCGN